MTILAETDLYRPVKAYLESLGFDCKGEIGECDIVALHKDRVDGEKPIIVICELKLSFNLELVLQGIDRANSCDEVWLAVAGSRRGRGREADPRVHKLCKRLGFGLLAVFPSQVELLSEPTPYRPRADLKRRSRLVLEHRLRRGDPVQGGGTRKPVMTAYRQNALSIAAALADGPMRPRDLSIIVPDAANVLRHNVYEWFERLERGLYGLTASGHQALSTWPQPSTSVSEELQPRPRKQSPSDQIPPVR